MSSLVVIYSDMIQKETDIENKVLADADARVEFISDPDEFESKLPEIEILINANPIIDKNIINKMVKCKGIVRRGIGYDNVDIKHARAKGIDVCNVPDYCYNEVADLTLGLALCLIRRINLYDRDVKNGFWHIDSATEVPLAIGMHRMTFGLIGLGNIARGVAKRAHPFFKDIIASDPYVSNDIAEELNVKMVDSDEVFEKADVISLHIPSMGDNYRYVNARRLSLMKPTAYLINTSRGQLVDEEALYVYLKDKKIAGAALDVLEIEPPNKNRLMELKNIILTPHIGFYSSDSFIALRTKAVEEARRALLDEGFRNKVN